MFGWFRKRPPDSSEDAAPAAAIAASSDIMVGATIDVPGESALQSCALTADQQADRIEGPDNFLMPREEIQKWRLANRES
jgi:hypothetical protein